MLSVRQIQELAATQLHEVYTDTRITALLIRWINEGVQNVASAGNWKWQEGLTTLTYGGHGAGANTSVGVTYLPHYIHQPLSVWPSGRNYREQLKIIGGWDLDALDPSMISGEPGEYLAVFGYYNVARDNPTAGLIACADAGGATLSVHIKGIDVNGWPAEEDVQIVAGGPNNTVNQYAAGPGGVRDCYIIEDPTTITGVPTIVTFTSTGTVIERLNFTLGEFRQERVRTEISPAPVAGTANYVTRYLERIRPVRTVNDIVPIPDEFEDLLTLSIERRLAAYQGGTRKQDVPMYEMMFRERIKEMKGWQNRQPGRMKRLRSISLR